MALVAKPVSVTTPQNVTANRPATVARAGPTSNLGGAIESINPTSGALIEDGAFSAVAGQGNQDFLGQSPFSSRRDNSESPPDPRTGIVNVTSQGFVELLELRDTVTSGGAGDGSGADDGARSGRLIGQAVALYEASIEISAGNMNLRGETISMTL